MWFWLLLLYSINDLMVGINIAATFRLLRNGILNVLAISDMRPKPPPTYLTILRFCFTIAQLISFIVRSDLGGPPWTGAMAPFSIAVSFTTLNGYQSYFDTGAFALIAWWIAIVWTGLVLGLLIYGVFCFAKNEFPWVLPLKIIRIMGNLSSGVLFIPLLQMLLSTTTCTALCGPTMTIVQIVISALAALFLSALSLLFVGVFYESDIWSRNVEAQAHGRLNIVMLCVQLVLVISFTAMRVNVPTLRLLILFACGITWGFAVIYYMPYYSHLINRLLAGGAVLYLAGVVSLAFNYFSTAIDASILYYLLAPLAFIVGVGAADARANSISCSPAERMTSPYEVELKARYMLHQFLFGHPIFSQQRSYMTVSSHDERAAILMKQIVPPSSFGSLHSSNKTSELDEVHVNPAASVAKTSTPATRTLTTFHKNTTLSPGAPRPLSDEELAELLDVYRSASTRRFSESAIIHLFSSRFFGHVLGNRHMQMSHLLQADRCSSALDVAFTIFQSRRLLENDAAQKTGGSGSGSAISRVSFEKYAADARRNVQRAAARQFAFWAELNELSPDLSRLHSLSRQTNDAVRAAESDFLQVFRLSPQALAQLRLYAAFNLHVTSNHEKASALLAEAERIEDIRSKEHRTEAGSQIDILSESNLDVWSDSTAIVTTSNNVRDLGVILTLNTG